MKELIEGLVERAAEHFSGCLKKFTPWHGSNGITERNLSFQLATAFLRQFPDSLVFMEVPFTIQDRTRADTHLDAYLFSEQLAILLECKILYAKDHVEAIVSDMERMSPPLLHQIQTRHRDAGSRQAKNTVCMVLAETWRLENVEWWCGEAAKKPRWSRDLLPKEGWTYQSKVVHQEHDGTEGTLYWLYAFRSMQSGEAAAGA